MLSVVCPSVRVGGLDLLCQSLALQSCQDFELVLVDGIFEYRRPHVAERLAAQPFPVQHLNNSGNGIPLSDYSSSINNAIVAARGDIILMLPDYSWLPPDCIETHSRYHDAHQGEKKILCSGYSYTRMPLRNPAFLGYHPNIHDPAVAFHKGSMDARYEAAVTAEAERYEADLKAGKLDEVMWSLFAKPPTPESIAALDVTYSHKLFGVEFSWRFCSLKNESFPIEAWLDANGLDEDLDGSHLYQDFEFATRLDRLGWEFDRVEGGELIIPNPRDTFFSKRILRPMHLNEAEAQSKLARGLPVNPGFSLRERRAARG